MVAQNFARRKLVRKILMLLVLFSSFVLIFGFTESHRSVEKKMTLIALSDLHGDITPDFFKNPDRKKSNERFYECMKAIKIDGLRCSRQIENLNQRFIWHKKDTSYGYLQ